MEPREAARALSICLDKMNQREVNIWQEVKNYFNGLITEDEMAKKVIEYYAAEIDFYSICG